MKPQDFMEALGGVSQEKLDALAKWQNAKTPIAGESPAKENRITQTADKPVFAVRRRGTMKQNTKKKASAAQINPWKIGVGVAVAACAAIAVFIGGGIISLDKQMQVGSNAGTSITEQLSEREPLPIEVRAADGIDIDMNLPEGGKAEVLRSVDDAQAWIDLLKQSGEYGRETGEGFHPCLEILEMEKEYLDHDIIMCAVPYHFMQSNSGVAQHAFFGGTITESGKLTVETGMVTVSKEMRPLILQDTETYCVCFTVPKNTMPEITGFTLNNQIYDCTAPLPDDIRSEHDMTEYLAELPEYQAYAKRFSNELYLRWVEDEIQTADASDRPLPEDCTEVQPEAETLAEPFDAWYWINYKGKSIPLDGITVDLIRTAADGEKYLTGDPEQNDTALRTQLSKEWLETGFDEEQVTDPVSGTVFSLPPGTPVQDLIFIGVPAKDMPKNMMSWGYHNGTVTPSGKLHLDFSVMTVRDETMAAMPDNKQYDDDTNFYFFLSVPEGAMPDLTDWTISFTEYHTDALPRTEEEAAWTENNQIGLDGTRSWLDALPECQSWWASVLGGKFITPVPEQMPDTIPVTGSYMVNTKNISPQLENATPVIFAENYEGSGKDRITLLLPIHDEDARTSLSDLHISADGTLSVTLNELYSKHDVDLTQDTAWVIWMLDVPHGSIPAVTGTDVKRVDYDKWSLDENFDETGFMHIAGELKTVTTE